MSLCLRNKSKLLITFRLLLKNPSLDTLQFLQRAYLKRGLYGFHSYIFSFYNPSFFSEISTNLFTISRCYPQPIVTNKKQVEKKSLFLLYPLCVNCKNYSVIHNYNCAFSTNSNCASTNSPWRYTLIFNVSPICFSLYKCLRN